LGSAKIIWARDMGREKDEELLRAYPGRQAWLAYRHQPWRQLVRGAESSLGMTLLGKNSDSGDRVK
jgi:hypothetical protein